MSRRTTALFSALFSVLLIAALALAGGAGARTDSSNAGSLTGAGSTFVTKLVQAWIPKVDNAFGIKVTYGPIGSGGGIHADHEPDRRLRCERCAADPRPGQRLQGLLSDPLGALRDVDPVQAGRRAE